MDGFEESGGETRESGSVFGVEAAFGDSAKSARERVCEGGGGDEIAGEGFANFGSGLVSFAEVAELALVMKAVGGRFRVAEHAAAATVRKAEGTQGIAR